LLKGLFGEYKKSMEMLWTIEDKFGAIFGILVHKVCRKIKKTRVAYKDKIGKQSKLPETTTFNSELRFEKMNNCWKCIDKEKPSINPKFGLVHFLFMI
jgi:hypothetical protein